MMKKLFFLVLPVFVICSSYAQSLTEVEKHMYYHRYQSAKALAQSVIAQQPESPDAWYWLGEIYLLEKKPDSAALVFKQGVDFARKGNMDEVKHPLVFIGQAHWLLNTGEKQVARDKFNSLLAFSKFKDPVALLAVANANIESEHGDPEWAVELLEKAAKKDKNNPAIYVAIGDAYRKQINGSQAVLSFDKALSIDKKYAAAYYKKGLIYKTQKNTEIYTERFTNAVEADSTYAPALYELYYHYFYRDIAKAGQLLNQYIRHADPSPAHAYMYTDYLFTAGNYELAVDAAEGIIRNEGKEAKPRLYKLIAYSQAAKGDSVSAEENMENYFKYQPEADCVSKDFELMALLKEANHTDKALSVEWYKKALHNVQDVKDSLNYMLSLAEIQKELGNREREAVWRENIFRHKDNPTNLDIYNWGLALYMAEDYKRSDSVFGMYSRKYPAQVFGYLWQARCNAVLDSTMEKGQAVPHYKKLIEVALADAQKNKSSLLKAYGYLGTYEANIQKDYCESLNYFEKMLELDPDNNDAQRYVGVLKKWIEKEEANKPD